MALRDLQAFLEDDGLDYPVWEPSFSMDADGKSTFPEAKACTRTDCPADGRHVHYQVPSPSAKTGLWLQALWNLGSTAAAGGEISAQDRASLQLSDDEERSLYQRVLGRVFDEMLADEVNWSALCKIGQDAYLCFAQSQDIADLALAGQGERLARGNRATRRGAKRTAGGSSRRVSTASATRTRKQGSHGSSTPPNGSGQAAAG